jgi:hypothetical protein
MRLSCRCSSPAPLPWAHITNLGWISSQVASQNFSFRYNNKENAHILAEENPGMRIKVPKWAVALLIGALLLAGGVLLGSFVGHAPRYNQPSHETSAETNPGTKNRENRSEFWQWFTAEEWTAIFTLCGAAFTFFLGIGTLGLWVTTRKGIRTQIRDTRILQRAYISVEPLGIAPFVSGHDKLSCDAGMRNVGHLPASNVRWSFEVMYSSNRDEKIPTPKPSDPTDGPLVIPPGTVIRKGVGPALNKAEFEQARDYGDGENRWLYMWGRVTYEDGFGKRRFTDFCHRYNLFAAGGSLKIDPRHARYHQDGNKTDESE